MQALGLHADKELRTGGTNQTPAANTLVWAENCMLMAVLYAAHEIRGSITGSTCFAHLMALRVAPSSQGPPLLRGAQTLLTKWRDRYLW